MAKLIRYRTDPKIRHRSKEEGKDQASIQSSTTPNPEHRMGKCQKHKKTSRTREPRGQPFPSTHHKTARHRQDNMAKTNTNIKYPHKKYRLGTVSKKITGGLKLL